MDDGKLNMNVINNMGRTRDLKRVHDSARKQKKEKHRTEDGREFEDFLEENDQVVEGFQEFVPEEPIVQAPSQKMLDLLGSASGPPIHIEPIEEATPSNSEETENDKKKDNGDQD